MYAVLIYGFPLLLLLFEWGLRVLIQVDSSGFTGPTLAAAGLSFLMPLTKPKQLNIQIPGNPNAIAISRTDTQFMAFTWMVIFGYLFLWALTCYTSIKLPMNKVFSITTHLFIGSCAYVFSLVMTFVKEKV